MKKKITYIIIFLAIIILGGCIPLSDSDQYQDLIKKEAVLQKKMVLVDVENYAFFWIDHLVDPSRSFWAEYKIITDLEKGQLIELTDIKSFVSKSGRKYLVAGRFTKKGTTYNFHYALPPGVGKLSKKTLEEVWAYQ